MASDDPVSGDPRLLDLADSISSGAAVDWEVAERSASSEEERRMLRQLRILAGIADFHRGESEREGERLPATPARWGHLELLERVGAGVFGEVFRARDTRLDREVALKLLAPRPGDLGSQVIHEGRLLARVRHPNVVIVHGADRIDGRTGLWMELVRGRTLEETLGEQGPFGAREAALIGLDLCRALAAVHGAGLVHRDVKLRNVMREAGGRIVLMDFGLGTEPGASGSPRSISGSPLYLAPEVLDGRGATVRSDIYSLGVALYRLVTGSYPVAGKTADELRAAHRRDAVRRLRDARPDLPAAFVQVVERALAPDPAARFASAGEMEQALARALGVEAPRPAGHTRRGALAVAGVMIAAVLTLLVLYLAGGSAYQVQASFFRDAGGRAELLASGARVAPGDELFLELRGSRRLHVYVLNEDERGEAYLLFPLSGYDLANPLPAGGPHRLPGRRSGREVHWQVTSAGGREHFLVVASPRPLAALEREIAALPRAESGRPVVAAPLGGEAVSRLRGTGGLVERAPAPAAPGAGGTRLAALARELGGEEESVRGVWMRRIDLENPGP